MSLDDDFVRLKEEISKILETKLEGLKKEIVKEIIKEISKIEPQDEVTPLANLKKIFAEAEKQVTKQLALAYQLGDPKKIEEAKKMQEKILVRLDEISKDIRQINEEFETAAEIENPIIPKKWYHRWFPWLLYGKGSVRSERNWIALLFAGVGLGLIFNGISEASSALQSIQGSLILGAIILALLAWLEKRRVFSLLGQE